MYLGANWEDLFTNLIIKDSQSRACQGGPGARPPLQSKCCFYFFSWILAEICLKCIILVTNFQKSPSAGGWPTSAPLNLQYWCPKVKWFDQIGFFKLIVTKSNFKKLVITSFLWRHHHYVITITSPRRHTKWRYQNMVTKFFHFAPFPPIKISGYASVANTHRYNTTFR